MERMDSELDGEGLAVVHQIDGEFASGEPYRIRGYEGADSLGNRRGAVRVATRYGIIMAIGPVSSHEAMQGKSVELLAEVTQTAGSRQWRSGQDVNADGLVDVMLRRDGRRLELWAIHEQGATPYRVETDVAMVAMMDVDGDGVGELMGELLLGFAAPQHTNLVKLMGFSSGRYIADTPAVKDWYKAQQQRETLPRSHNGPRDSSENSRENLIENATKENSVENAVGNLVQGGWWRLCAGQDVKQVLGWWDEQVKRGAGTFDRERETLRYWRAWLRTDPCR